MPRHLISQQSVAQVTMFSPQLTLDLIDYGFYSSLDFSSNRLVDVWLQRQAC